MMEWIKGSDAYPDVGHDDALSSQIQSASDGSMMMSVIIENGRSRA